MNKEDIREVCTIAVDNFFYCLFLRNIKTLEIKELLNIKTFDDLVVIFNNFEKEYKKEYEKIYSYDFLVSFLEYYGSKSKYFDKYSDKRQVFSILFGFLEAIHRFINSQPYFLCLKDKGYVKNEKKEIIYFNKGIEESCFKEILENPLLNEQESIYIYLINYNFNKDIENIKFFNIYRYLNDTDKNNVWFLAYSPNIVNIARYLYRCAKDINSENLDKILRREERENLDELREYQIVIGKIADEINEKIKEEVDTNSFICDNFYEIFSNLEPKTFKKTVTRLSGYGVMPIGEFFLSGGQLLNR